MLYLRKRKIALKKILHLVGLFCLSISVLQVKDIFFSFLPFNVTSNYSSNIGLVIIICLIGYKPLDRFLNFVFREYFFKKRVGYHFSLMQTVKHLSACLDLKEFSNLIVNTFCDLLEVKYATFFVYDKEEEKFVSGSMHGFDLKNTKKVVFSREAPLIKILSKLRFPILRGEILKKLNWPEASQLNSDLELLRAQIVIPLVRANKVIAFISLSSKPSHMPYFPHELRLFNDFVSQISIALENAIKYQALKLKFDVLEDCQSDLMQSNKFSAIEYLANGIAHEIHNPLTIISGKAQMLLLSKDKNILTEKTEEDLRNIVQQTKRAADITRKLLVFSKQSPEYKELISFSQIIDDTLELISYQTSLDQIKIDKRVSHNVPPYRGSISEFREVFLNLILNSVQSVEREGNISIWVADLEEENGLIEITVEDNGCGISKENVSSIFDPFYTTKQNGLGLGLFVTQRIVQRNGGFIRVSSELGQGTCVTIRLPIFSEEEIDVNNKTSLGSDYNIHGAILD